MPLILLTGLPSSGKTTLSKLLCQELIKRLEEGGLQKNVRVVSDSDHLDWNGRNVIYNDISKEKELRGSILSEAQRYINLDNIVILDVAAYIKGFRYELYCRAKEAKTQYCVIELLPPIEACRKRNKDLITELSKLEMEEGSPEPGYNDSTFDGLVMRYEKCDEKNRWDSPLFRLNSEEDQLNYNEIFKLVTEGYPLIPNKSTSLTQSTKTIFN